MTAEIRARIGRDGPENHNFKGGWEQANGWSGRRYGFVWVAPEQRPLHPTLNRKGVMRRSHYVWNIAHPDNPVLKGQVIHHVNNDSLDDRPENLEKKVDQADHMKSHEPGNWRTRARDAEGHFI